MAHRSEHDSQALTDTALRSAGAESLDPGTAERPDTAVVTEGASPRVPAPGAPSVATLPLESLTPNYDEKHHGTYLQRLDEAVKDPHNLNIALTGRYGSGKSSVLDKFVENHHEIAQRLVISTLAPGEQGESTTNRIQKEMVEQLLYGASEKVKKNSRFNKIAILPKRRAFKQSAAFVVCVGGLLYLFNLLPNIKWTGPDHAIEVRFIAWLTTAFMATLVVCTVRLLTYGRFNVKDVKATGAALTLTEKPQSYFDMYLDEIVHYF